MTQLCFSQENYPRKQVQNGDTLVVITPTQLGLVNGIIQERNDLRDCLVPELESVVARQDSLVLLLNTKATYLNDINIKNQEIILNLKDQTLQAKHKNMKTTFIVGGVCICVGFLAGTLLFLRK